MRWVFGMFMGPSDLRERNSLAYREAWPACLKRGVYVACRCCLRFRREVIAAQKKELDILEHHLPERNRRSCGIRSVGRNGSTHSQERDITLDICPKRDFHNMVDSLRSKDSYALLEFRIVQKDLVRS
jgi:phosphatidylserine/phosphatidylglycerophosphate/cardiolipin synthase-like enzyme